MKKFALSVLILVCTLLCAVSFTACNRLSPCEQGRHKNLKWVQAPSYCAYVCKECGFVVETATHNFTNGKCVLCGISYDTYLNSFNGRYGYNYLGTMTNGEGLQKLYSAIEAEVRPFHESGESVSADYRFAVIDFSEYNLNMDEAVIVYKTFIDDNPLYYWLSNALTYTVDSIILAVDGQYADGESRTDFNKKLYSKAEEWTKIICNESSAYMKALAFHDFIIDSVDYAYDEDGKPQSAKWAHSALGVLEERGAVCEGYAKAFQLLLNACGVENILVSGDGKGESHAWNLVRLDDSGWYWYDLTYDDTPDCFWGISYDYCATTDDSFLKDHTADVSSSKGNDFLYDLPNRAQTAYAGGESNINGKFTVNSFEYLIIGYDGVSLSNMSVEGNVEIPSSVSYGGREYKVKAIGDYDRYGEYSAFFIGSYDNVTTLFIPSTVKFIAYNSFCGWRGIKEINVDENNTAYSSIDGVLFTKSHDTLIVYPNAREGVSYSIPEETTKIGSHAFGGWVFEGRKLESLTVHTNVELVGVVNWGWGYGNIVTGGWEDIINSLTGKRELIIDEENPYFKVKDGSIYNGDYSYVYATFK